MRRLVWWVLAAAIVIAPLSRACATTLTGGSIVKWHTTPIVRLTLTPNYSTGYGSVQAIFGTQPTPTHGPDAPAVGTGAVDFGQVLAGASYLYKYAVHLNVYTTSSTGFDLYGEGAADFFNQTDSTSQAIAQTLFYVPSKASGDANTGFTPGFPFLKTMGSETGGGSFATPPTITYASYPNPVAASSLPSQDLYYDYLLKVPPAATQGSYYVWIVYTVVPA